MIKKAPLQIVGGSQFSRYPKISRESTYNMRISDSALVTYFGYRKIKDIRPGGAIGRSVYTSPKYQHQIAVIDNGVYTISNDFAISLVGNIDTSTGSVFISENNANQIVITENSSNIYIFNYSAETFVKTNVGFIAGYLTFIDGYIISPALETHQWRLSDLNNASSFPFDSQHIGELESSPDVVVAAETLERQLFIFGKNVTEVWLDVPTSSALFPFQRQNSLSIEYGCISPNTIASGFHRMVWLGSNEASGPSILVSTGSTPKKIATDGIDFELDNLSDPENSFGFLFEEDGHVFYQISFPSDNVSYAYDFNEDKFFNVTDSKLNAHIARRLSFFNNKHLFITDRDGGLYEMSSEFTTYKETTDKNDDGLTIPRIRIPPPFRLKDASRFIINNVNLTIEQGYSDKDLDVHLSLSKDGSQSFGTKLSKQLNPMGKRANKLLYRKLGSANDVSFQFQFWGNDRFIVTDAEMELFQ
jgi:hypothetical protein